MLSHATKHSHSVLAVVSNCCSQLGGKLLTRYSPFRHCPLRRDSRSTCMPNPCRQRSFWARIKLSITENDPTIFVCESKDSQELIVYKKPHTSYIFDAYYSNIKDRFLLLRAVVATEAVLGVGIRISSFLISAKRFLKEYWHLFEDIRKTMKW